MKADWIARVDPQPPRGIHYVIGGESWLDPQDRTPVRLVIEEWGIPGCYTKVGFNVRATEIVAPPGVYGVERGDDGVLYWSRRDCFGRLREH